MKYAVLEDFIISFGWQMMITCTNLLVVIEYFIIVEIVSYFFGQLSVV